jgi:ABC-type multidrug transport system ATPase subunit
MPMDGKHPTLVDIQNVSKIFKSDIFKKPFQAVNQLSISFPQGFCTGLLGHNGAGKTTTIRMLLGLIFPDQGRILFEDRPLNIEHKKFIGYMPEVNKLPLNLTCEEILRFTLALREPLSPSLQKQSRGDLITRKLEDLGLSAQRAKKVKNLSKGLARRLAFAQATIHEPRFLILDEPTSGLDPSAAKLLEQLILLEKSRGTTILLCTHELSHLSTICDHVHLLKKGQLALTSLPSPQTPTTTTKFNKADANSNCLGPRVHLTVRLKSHQPISTLEAAHRGLPPWTHSQETSVELGGPNTSGRAFQKLEFKSAAEGQKWLCHLIEEGHDIVNYQVGIQLRDDEVAHFYGKDL